MRKLSFVDWVFALLAVTIVAAGAVVMFGRDSAPVRHQNMGTADLVPAAHSDGLSEAESGYRFERVVMPVGRGPAVPVAFRIVGADGKPVTRFLDNQTRQMHFFAVRDDMHVFRHVHPVLEGKTWHTTLDLPDGGAYRMFAEFVPLDTKDARHPVVLGVPFQLAGDTELVPLPAPAASTVTTSGFVVEQDQAPVSALRQQTLRLRIRTPDGAPVSELQPHLGANGHMTGFHTMLLSATHLHPVEPAGAPLINGELTFQAALPERGEYRLFLEFSHGGKLHTAALTIDVT